MQGRTGPLFDPEARTARLAVQLQTGRYAIQTLFHAGKDISYTTPNRWGI